VILEIRLLGDPILRSRTKPVDRFDDDLVSLARDMIETMYDADGVGLAAPQVGDGRRMAVVDVSDRRDASEVLALVNPLVVRREGTIPSEEGCLSIPGVVETIERAEEVEVEYQDLTGATRRVAGRDLLSRALQHEIDHLDGILFIDHLGAMRRRMVVREWEKKMKAAREEAVH
jgi:peptide deformylase